MDRRSFFTSLKNSPSALNTQPANAPMAGLEPYVGDWDFSHAAHLLRRTMFGPSSAQIQAAVDLGLTGTLAQLMDPSAISPQGPLNMGKINIDDELVDLNDAHIAVGAPWVEKIEGVWTSGALPQDEIQLGRVQNSRSFSLQAWKTEKIVKEGMSIYEKMTLFWHNHFGVTGEIPEFVFLHMITLMENSLGNFRELVKKITLDPAMMRFLNGNENDSAAPNENYARELFELFTIGKGPLAGPGDYTYYTEDDILAASRVLTGWKVRILRLFEAFGSSIPLTQENLLEFVPQLHDQGSKQFSQRFDNTVLTDGGDQEFAQLVDMIFQQDECARFICRKLYRWFVYYKISEETEELVIEPMAQILIDNDYEIQPALEALLKSQHFYDVLNLGPMIKNPYDFICSATKPFNFFAIEPQDLVEKYIFYSQITSNFTLLQMTYFAPPDVAGWKAYYQEPLYYRTWINTTTLNLRMFITAFISTKVPGNPDTPFLPLLDIVGNIQDATDPNILIDSLAQVLFPQELTQEQKDYLKAVLLPGLPDFEWTVEYGDFLSDPTNIDLRESVELKLGQLFNAMLAMPEFYLS